jgi:hypothetical protein
METSLTPTRQIVRPGGRARTPVLQSTGSANPRRQLPSREAFPYNQPELISLRVLCASVVNPFPSATSDPNSESSSIRNPRFAIRISVLAP